MAGASERLLDGDHHRPLAAVGLLFPRLVRRPLLWSSPVYGSHAIFRFLFNPCAATSARIGKLAASAVDGLPGIALRQRLHSQPRSAVPSGLFMERDSCAGRREPRLGL